MAGPPLDRSSSLAAAAASVAAVAAAEALELPKALLPETISEGSLEGSSTAASKKRVASSWAFKVAAVRVAVANAFVPPATAAPPAPEAVVEAEEMENEAGPVVPRVAVEAAGRSSARLGSIVVITPI
eukprot:GHVU01079361.1.p3 GENE.GHVU01079361.1~~GHVU01079361.1.p3  ORF type:complete len:128 (-),score=30.85 GHVU01079361.1:1244-1627(-)